MGVPISQMATVASYVLRQKLAGEHLRRIEETPGRRDLTPQHLVGLFVEVSIVRLSIGDGQDRGVAHVELGIAQRLDQPLEGEQDADEDAQIDDDGGGRAHSLRRVANRSLGSSMP